MPPTPRTPTQPSAAAVVGSAWSRPFVAGVAVYFLLQMASRIAVSPSAHLDESEQAVFTQSLQWGYGPQPPLYTWLQWLVFTVTGPTLLGLSLLKNAILGGITLLSYRLGTRVTGSEPAGRLTALSLALVPDLVWEAQRDLTHSVLAALLGLAWLERLLRLPERGRWRDYLLAGVVLGLGCLSKYNFGIGATAAVLAGLTLPAGRRALLRPRFLLTLAVALALVGPHARWVVQHPELALATAGKFRSETDSFRAADAVPSLLRAVLLTVSALSTVTPLAVVLGLAGWGMRCGPTGGTTRSGLRWIRRYLLIAAGMVVLGLAMFQATDVRGRWFLPLWVALPTLLTGLAWPRLDERRIRRLTVLSLTVAVAVALVLPARILFAERLNRFEPLHLPFATLAQQLTPFVVPGTVVWSDSLTLAGNLRLAGLPARYVTPETSTVILRSAGEILLVWDATREAGPPEAMTVFARRLGFRETSERRYFEARCYYHAVRTLRLGAVSARRGTP